MTSPQNEASRHQRIEVAYLATTALTPDPNNARKHGRKQLIKLGAAISRFGFLNPILIDEAYRVIAGNGRLAAALELKLEEVPCVVLTGLTDDEKMALAIADNKLGDLSTFDPDRLAEQLTKLETVEFEIETIGFDTAEIDILAGIENVSPPRADPDDLFAGPELTMAAVSRSGDLWTLGGHKLLCANALEESSYRALLGDEKAAMAFADSPYNVSIPNHASGLGRARHREFAMASGEMSRSQFIAFLTTAMKLMTAFSADGSLHFQCMDWRHAFEMLAAGEAAYTELKALCVWNKGSGGMGSLYRSQHEFVFVFKNGVGRHVNNVELGKHGRYRTNVWDYPGLNSFGKDRADSLAAHPCVKPVSLIADAMRDCSERNALVLDPFAGSGTTIIAAERSRRRAAAIEIDPHYVDVAVRRWQNRSGQAAILAADGRTFAQVEAERKAP